MTPARLGPIHRDDELLDALGARQETPARERDELTALLSGWTRHVDAGTTPVADLASLAGQPHRAGRPPWRRRARIASAALAVTLTFSGGSVAAALVNTHIPVLQQLGTVGTYFLHGVLPTPAQQLPSPAPDGRGGLPAGPVGGSAGTTHAPTPVGDRQQHGGERGPDRRRAVAPGPSPAPSGSSTTSPGRPDAGTAPGQSGSATTPSPAEPSPGAGSPTDEPAGSVRPAQPPASGAAGSGGSAQRPTPGGPASVPGAGVDVPDPLRVRTTPEDAAGDRSSSAPQQIAPEPGAPAVPRSLAPPDLPPLPEQAAPPAHVTVPRSALDRTVSGKSAPPGGAPAEGPETTAP